MNDNLAYQDEFREELIGGELIAMSPAATNHNRISRNIFGIFWSYLKGKKCEPFGDGEAVYLTDDDHFIPDFMVVCDPDKIKQNGVHGAPDLVVEVLSFSTAKRDRGYKKDVYEQCGVREYWIVNPADKSVEVHLLIDGKFVLDNIYSFYTEEERAEIRDDEKALIVSQFKCSLYDDLEISLEDVFYRTF